MLSSPKYPPTEPMRSLISKVKYSFLNKDHKKIIAKKIEHTFLGLLCRRCKYKIHITIWWSSMLCQSCSPTRVCIQFLNIFVHSLSSPRFHQMLLYLENSKPLEFSSILQRFYSQGMLLFETN